MRVAILGGTGFIGRHVTRRLVETGADVATVERGITPSATPDVRSIRADRRDAPGLASALATAAPAVVIDMIAYSREDIDLLLDALPASVERLVVISSGDVYASYGMFLGLSPGPGDPRPSDERAALRKELFPYRRRARGPGDPLHAYEKILVERAANGWTGGATTVLRLPMVYGPEDRQRRVQSYVERFRASDGSIRLNADEAAWRGSRGYVEDVAAGIALAATSRTAAGRVFNLGEPSAFSEAEWAAAIAAAAGWEGGIVIDPQTPPSLPASWRVDLTVDTSRIRQVLGYEEPVGREEGLRRTLASSR